MSLPAADLPAPPPAVHHDRQSGPRTPASRAGRVSARPYFIPRAPDVKAREGPTPVAATPCVDAELLVSSRLLEALLQLPTGWTVAGLRPAAGAGEAFVVDVVFGDGPTGYPPIGLEASYAYVRSVDGQVAITRTGVDLANQPPTAGPFRRRRGAP